MKKVLVAVDEYAASIGAAKKAVELAVKYNASLLAVQVEEELILTPYEKEEESLAVREYMDKISDKPLDLIAAYAKKQNVDVQVIKVTGMVASSILKIADEQQVDFVVVGDSARKGLERMHFGSVAISIIQRSIVPVIVVRHGIVDISDLITLATEKLEEVLPKEEITAPVFNQERYSRNLSLSFKLCSIFIVTYFIAALLTTSEMEAVASFQIVGVPVAVILGMLVFVVGLGVTQSYLKKS
jgi:nucleotide-binding universal stress UspA family protein/uncharacterized membrane protein (DUF485 family)